MAKSHTQQCAQQPSCCPCTGPPESQKPAILNPGAAQDEKYHGNTQAGKQRSSGSSDTKALVAGPASFREPECSRFGSDGSPAAAAAESIYYYQPLLVGPAGVRTTTPGIHAGSDSSTTSPSPLGPTTTTTPSARQLCSLVEPSRAAAAATSATTIINHDPPRCGKAVSQPGGASRWSKPVSWFQFPPEIRNMIYDISLVWPDSTALYAGYNRQIDAYYARQRRSPAPGGDEPEPFPVFAPHLWTPPLLLLCRAITAECLPVLRARPLVIDRLPPWPPGADRPLAVPAFLGRRTLQSLARIDLRVSLGAGRFGSGWVWGGVVRDLFSILLERNAFRSLRLLIRLSQLGDRNVWVEEDKVHWQILEQIDELRRHNPNIWRPGEIELEYWQVIGFGAMKLRAPTATSEGANEISRMELERHPEDERRIYPDEEIWPGSILEFL